MRGVDFIVVRELCGGIYFGAKTEQASNASSSDDDVSASDTCTYSVGEIRRVTCVAGALARDMARSERYSSSGAVARVTSIDKANVLASSRLWRRVVSETMAKEFPEVELKHLFVDAAAMHMVGRLYSIVMRCS